MKYFPLSIRFTSTISSHGWSGRSAHEIQKLILEIRRISFIFVMKTPVIRDCLGGGNICRLDRLWVAQVWAYVYL